MGFRLVNNSKKHNYGLISFLLGIGIACLFFIPNIIYSGGYFIFYGDFNAQQIPFYQMVHDSVLNGNTMWSSTTDLGANLVGSYSFYLIGSPFFWITLLFPSSAVPYLMGPLLILKFGCASLTAYLYLKRYVSHKGYAVAGGLLYAFSGFGLYNIFFNHFHEAIVIFPLLLFAIDEYMYKKRKGIVALTVCAACVMNYYFFVGQVVFVIIYWVIRICVRSFPKISFKELLILAFEVIIGFLMSAVILLPSIMSVLQNYRISTWPEGWYSVIYDKPQRYVHIIESFFFPPDIAARPNFTPDSDSNWASIAGWLPLVGMTGVIGFLQARGQHWLKKLIPLLFVMAMVPLFNAVFQGLNMNYYARWFYMAELMLVLATVKALDSNKTDWLRATRLSAGITAVILLIIGLMPYKDYSNGEDNPVFKIGLENYPERLWIYGGISLCSICGFALIIKVFKNNKRAFIKAMTAGIAIVVFLCGNFVVYLGMLQNGTSREFILDYALDSGDKPGLDDIKNVRSDFYDCVDNLGMYWQIPNIQAFHSIVPGSVMEFYPNFDVTRDVSSHPDVKAYGLRGLLSVKYLFDDPSDESNFYKDEEYKMPGWKYLDYNNGVSIYENSYYIPMGFMYDDFICEEEFELIDSDKRDKAILKAMVLSQKQIKKYSDITSYIDGEFDELNDESKSGVYNSRVKNFVYTNQSYFSDCNNRKAQSCSDFKYVNNGFKATIDNKGEDNLLFFSVPYEEGWTAYVNGERAEIEKVNIGFMAVKVDGHKKSNIEFRYVTPGISAGGAVTIFAFLAYVVYFALVYLIIPRRSRRKN